MARRKNNYLSNENLLREIDNSKKIQKKYPKKYPSECLTNDLVKMIMLLIERYSTKRNFRNYTYIEDMKADAMLLMCNNALKFNPEKSNNPFAYYTRIIHRSFLTYIHKEHQQRDIRDDIIEMSNTNFKPTISRQLDSDMQKYDTYVQESVEAT